jgi:hypothetical protein
MMKEGKRKVSKGDKGQNIRDTDMWDLKFREALLYVG